MEKTVRAAGALALSLAGVYALTLAAVPDSSDGYTVMSAARALRTQGTLRVGCDLVGAIPAPGGCAPAFGILPILIETPLEGLATGLARALVGAGADRAEVDGVAGAILSLLWGLHSAATAGLLVVVAARLGAPPITGVLAGLAWGLAGPGWPYGRTLFNDAGQALWMLAAFGLAFEARRRRRRAWAAIAGGVLGLAVLTKSFHVLAAAPLVLYLWRGGVAVFPFLAGLAPAIAIQLLYNWVRFGEWLEFGYSARTGVLYDNSIVVGLFGQFLSPGRGLLWYWPPLVLVLASLGAARKRFGAEASLVLATVALEAVVIAACRCWYGGWCWGPRYAVAWVPLLTLLALPSLSPPIGRTRAVIVGLVLGAGTMVQALGCLIAPSTVIALQKGSVPGGPWSRAAFTPSGDAADARELLLLHFVPELSPLAAHAWLLSWTLRARDAGETPEALAARMLADCPWADLDPAWLPRRPDRALGLDLALVAWPARYPGKALLIRMCSLLAALVTAAGAVALRRALATGEGDEDLPFIRARREI